MTTLILVLAGVLGLGLAGGALWLGRRWGLAKGRREGMRALAEQQEEFLRQQQAMQRLECQNREAIQAIDQAQSTEEAADVLKELHRSWSLGE